MKMFDNPILFKLFTLISKFGIVLFTFLSPLLPFIYCLFFLSMVDLITAIMKDIKIKRSNNGGERYIESRKLKKTGIKFGFYVIFLISIHWMMLLTFGSTFFIPNLVFGLFSLTEIVSIGENMANVTDNNIFIKITRRFTKFFTDKIEKMLE